MPVFEKRLADTLKRIFDLDKVNFNHISETQEQECIFIEIESSKNQIKDAKVTAKVTGKIKVYGNIDKLPYGYFSKRIVEAKPADTKNLFFYNIEENAGTFVNICERSMSFIYLFEDQYNPNLGEITDLISDIAFEGIS